MTDGDPSAVHRLELALAGFDRLRGTDMVRPLAAGRQGSVLYTVLPYVPGVTLESHLSRRSEPLTVAQALAVGRGILQPLAEAHDHGFLHSDVRPSNVIVGVVAGRIERATLIDLGAFQFRRLAGSPPQTGLRAARYASPEAAGVVAHDVDERSDLYAAGAVLFECLAGRPVFLGDTLGELLRQHLTEPVPGLRSLGLPVPGVLDEVVHRLLMKEPADLYASARAALADLDQIASGLEAGVSDPDVVVGALDTRRTLTQPSFVGREVELDAIEGQVARARAGHGGLVLVEGESGGGKTKLLDELAQRTGKRRTTSRSSSWATGRPTARNRAGAGRSWSSPSAREVPPGHRLRGLGPDVHIVLPALAALENADGFAGVQALSRSLERRVEERTAELADTNRQLTERSEAVELLKTIAVATNEASSVEAALQVALDEVCRHTGWPVGHVCRISDDLPLVAAPTEIWHIDYPERFATFRRVTEALALTGGARPGGGHPGAGMDPRRPGAGGRLPPGPNRRGDRGACRFRRAPARRPRRRRRPRALLARVGARRPAPPRPRRPSGQRARPGGRAQAGRGRPPPQRRADPRHPGRRQRRLHRDGRGRPHH